MAADGDVQVLMHEYQEPACGMSGGHAEPDGGHRILQVQEGVIKG